MSAPDLPQRISDIMAAMRELGLIAEGEQFGVAPFSGGVSCDVFCVDVKRRKPVVVKQALPKLRVAADWRAPVERSESEVDWIALATQLDPRLVPTVLAQDRTRHLFVMEYLPKEQYPVWKERLASGDVDPAFAGSVGSWLARLHASSALSPSIARRFANQQLFYSLRLEPYLVHTAEKHPDVAPKIRAIAEGVAHAQIALMHGDVSPKNILRGPETPVFLDAETACYGDPAFDLAFCLNHLLLKCVWHPEFAERYADAFRSLKDGYFGAANWEMRDHLETRSTRLLSALLLARIDGKSPVEYITADASKAFVRGKALAFLANIPHDLDALLDDWMTGVRAFAQK